MITAAEVWLWGRQIGAVTLGERGVGRFEFVPEFIGAGIEVAPLMMPVARRVYSFPGLNEETFHGLPGLLSDSLPDRFGTAVIDAWLVQQGRLPGSLSTVERLCYTGERGMGALTFRPTTGPVAGTAEQLELSALVRLASDVLAQRASFEANFDENAPDTALRQMLQVGTSAGGARAKAVIAWNRATSEIRSGQVRTLPSGFEHWLLKFDGVSRNGDRGLNDPEGFGAVEYAYYEMARQAGIRMTECRLLEENGRRHFMTRRFDRPDGGDSLHMQTLGALAHLDFNDPGANSYEQAFQAAARLGLPRDDLEQLVLRMMFNVVARNQDDHVKNVAFLMDRSGRWSLAPAYDVTYSYNPGGGWTAQHQMSVQGKRDGFGRDDVLGAARSAGLRPRRAAELLQQVAEAVEQWPGFAEQAAVRPDWALAMQSTFRRLL